VGHELIIFIENADAAVQFRDEDFVFVLVKAAGRTDIAGDRALVFEFERIDFDAIVVAVGDIDFRFSLEGVDPDSMAGVECAVGSIRADILFVRLRADCLDVLEIFVEPADALGAVTIDDVDVAVG